MKDEVFWMRRRVRALVIFGGWTLFGVFFAGQAYVNNSTRGRLSEWRGKQNSSCKSRVEEMIDKSNLVFAVFDSHSL